jgi:hypothetical protein
VQFRAGFYQVFVVFAQQTRNKAGGRRQSNENTQMTHTITVCVATASA